MFVNLTTCQALCPCEIVIIGIYRNKAKKNQHCKVRLLNPNEIISYGYRKSLNKYLMTFLSMYPR